MKILIFEDNEKELGTLLNYIESFCLSKNIIYTVDIYTNSKDFIENIYTYDLIFLDIEVQNENGIDIGIKIREYNDDAKIIFVTNYSKYLIDGYKAHADRYFLKPLNQEEFNIELENVLEDYIQKYSGFFDKKILKTKIYFNEILYIEFKDRKTFLHFITGKVIETNYPLKYWENKLGDHYFAKPYRAYLVNLRHISGFTKQEVIMENEEYLPISRLFKNEFEERYLKSLSKRI